MAKTEKDPAKVVLSTHRVSYVHLKEPSSFKNSDKKDYSIEFLIPVDHPDVARIEDAIQSVFDANKQSTFKGTKIDSRNFHYPLVDGEDILDDGKDRPEVEGHYVLKAKSSRQPVVYDADGSELYDLDDVYGGCYCRGVIVFRPFSHESGKKGISCYINSVKFMEDGEPFGGFSASHDDYEDEEPRRGSSKASSRKRPSRDEEEDEAPRRRSRRDEDDEPAPSRRRRASRDEEEDDAPPRRSRGRSRDDDEDEAPRRRRTSRYADEDDDLAD